MAADVVYGVAFHMQRLLRGLRYRSISRDTVTPEELWSHRQFGLATGLITGVTNICNAKCSFCAYPKVVANKTLETGIMSFAVFQKAVDEWARLGGAQLNLTPVVGDPLVDPGLLDKLDYAVKKGIRVLLTTNGILLDKNDTYRQLIDHGIREVYISAQGTSKAMYEQIFGVNRFDESMSGIRHLLEYNRSRGEPIKIGIRFRNAEKPSEIIRSPEFQTYLKPYFSEKVRVNFTVDFDNWGGTVKAEDLQGNMRLRQLPRQLNVPCTALFCVAIRHDGGVRLCGCRLVRNDMDDLVVGNIRENTMKELAEGDRAWSIIKGFYSGQRPETCRTCTFYTPVSRAWLKSRALAKARLQAHPQPAGPQALAKH
ncbi:MAG: radical SAM protein [Formivibrio sp.]|nr:radical SAM protein [Formivibrio sp.]